MMRNNIRRATILAALTIVMEFRPALSAEHNPPALELVDLYKSGRISESDARQMLRPFAVAALPMIFQEIDHWIAIEEICVDTLRGKQKEYPGEDQLLVEDLNFLHRARANPNLWVERTVDDWIRGIARHEPAGGKPFRYDKNIADILTRFEKGILDKTSAVELLRPLADPQAILLQLYSADEIAGARKNLDLLRNAGERPDLVRACISEFESNIRAREKILANPESAIEKAIEEMLGAASDSAREEKSKSCVSRKAIEMQLLLRRRREGELSEGEAARRMRPLILIELASQWTVASARIGQARRELSFLEQELEAAKRNQTSRELLRFREKGLDGVNSAVYSARQWVESLERRAQWPDREVAARVEEELARAAPPARRR